MEPAVALDHIVLATPSVERTSAWIADVIGIVPAPGGPHVGRGTCNDLCTLGDGAYLEIIGPDPTQSSPAEPRPFGLDRITGPGVVTWCARTTDLDGFVARAAAVGHPYSAPMSMARDAPGGRLDWRLALPMFDTRSGLVPFVIDWGASAHPSDTIPAHVELASLHGEHTQPTDVRSVVASLGVALDVVAGTEERLAVSLRGPAGQATLPVATFAR